MPMPIGVRVDDFRQPAKAALQHAADLGFRAVEVGAGRGDISPEALSDSGRRHFARYVRNLGLGLDALAADLYADAFTQDVLFEESLDRTRRILELAKDVGAAMVTARLGCVDEAASPDRREQILDAVGMLADHADKVGTVLAIETADERPDALVSLIRHIDCPMVRAAFDPAELIMDGNNPVAAVTLLADHIAIARVRDAVGGSGRRPGHETHLGGGQLDLNGYLYALNEAGYTGPAIIRRTEAQSPTQDIALAKSQLEAALLSQSM